MIVTSTVHSRGLTMMLHKLIPIVVAVATMNGEPARLVAQQPAGQKTLDIYSDPVVEGPQAKTLTERLGQVDAVIRCRIERSTVNVTHDSNLPEGADPMLGLQIATEHTATVLEILKDNPRLPPIGFSLKVIQSVGVAVVNGVQVRKVRGQFRPFAPGEEYVLLLQWNSNISAFTIEAPDTFRLTGGIVDTPGRSMYGTPFVGASEASFLTEVRLAAAASRH